MDPNKRPKQLNSPFVKTAMKLSSKAVVWVYRRTGGRVGGNWRIGAGFKKPVPTLLLEHRGRKSGKVFVSPLVYMTDGDNVIVVASMGGRAENPQWYHNLLANPAEDRERLWPKLVETYADFDTYQSWTDREIPVFILQPR